MSDLVDLVDQATFNAINDNRQDKAKVGYLVPYLNDLKIRSLTPNAATAWVIEPAKDGKPAKTVPIRKVETFKNNVISMVRQYQKQDPSFKGNPADLANLFIDSKLGAWNELSQKRRRLGKVKQVKT